MALMRTWLGRGRRLCANRGYDANDVRARLSPTALERITAQVVASEQRHSGELRICIEAGLPWSYIRRDATARDRALTLFGKLRVWDTEHNNGVLIYLLLAEHAIELVADRGLHGRVSDETWSRITSELGRTLAEQRFEEGLTQAIDVLTTLLITHFPRDGNAEKPNALPDTPLLLV